jgi:hypothetical protein
MDLRGRDPNALNAACRFAPATALIAGFAMTTTATLDHPVRS